MICTQMEEKSQLASERQNTYSGDSPPLTCIRLAVLTISKLFAVSIEQFSMSAC